jgi:hypothetical protein
VSHYTAIEQTGIQFGSKSAVYLYVTTDESIVGYAFDWTTGALYCVADSGCRRRECLFGTHHWGISFFMSPTTARRILAASHWTLDWRTDPYAGSPFRQVTPEIHRDALKARRNSTMNRDKSPAGLVGSEPGCRTVATSF